MQFNISDIISYYDSCESDYRLIWNLNRCGSMHFGFWDRNINSLPQALLRDKVHIRRARKSALKNSLWKYRILYAEAEAVKEWMACTKLWKQ